MILSLTKMNSLRKITPDAAPVTAVIVWYVKLHGIIHSLTSTPTMYWSLVMIEFRICQIQYLALESLG
jgi:hypothetical protein